MKLPTTLHGIRELAERLARDNPSYELTIDGDAKVVRLASRETLLGRGEVVTTLATAPLC